MLDIVYCTTKYMSGLTCKNDVRTSLCLGVQASFQHNGEDMDSYTTACLILGTELLHTCLGYLLYDVSTCLCLGVQASF